MTTKQPPGETVSFTLSLELKARLDAFAPRKRKGERRKPEFYRSIFESYLNSPEFRLKEATERLRRVESELRQLKARQG